MTWKPYASYAEADSELLERYPAHWELKRLKFTTANVIEKAPSSEDSIFVGLEQIQSSTGRYLEREAPVMPEGESNTFRKGDVLFGKLRPYLAKAWKCTFNGTCSSEFLTLRPREIRQGLLAYLVLCDGFLKAVDGSTYGAKMPRASWDFIGSLRVPVPPPREQVLMEAFLDRETAKIDALIAEQRDLIERLREKRESEIHKAVTQGLSAEGGFQKTNSPWLPVIPSGWAIGALTRIARRVVVGIAEAATHAYVDQGTPILRATNVRPNEVVGDLLYINPEFANDRGSKSLMAKDLVTVRTGNAGVTAVVPNELDGCQCFTMLITTLTEGHSAEFFSYYMNSPAARHYFNCEGWGTAQINISVPILKALPIPIPPVDEQTRIVDFIRDRIRPIDYLITEAEASITLLQEHRSALITAVVIGKVDVRGAMKEPV